MSEPLLARTQVIPSRLRRRLQQAAAALTLLAAALLAWAASLQRDLQSLGFLLLLTAFVLTLLAGGLLLRGLRPRTVDVEIAIAADGTITATGATWPERSVQQQADVRGALPDSPRDTTQGRRCVLVPVALTPLSVALRGDGRTVVVWRDSLAADGFRRLCAVARWRMDRRVDQRVDRRDGGPGDGSANGSAGKMGGQGGQQGPVAPRDMRQQST